MRYCIGLALLVALVALTTARFTSARAVVRNEASLDACAGTETFVRLGAFHGCISTR